jgi:hypothetical protein
MQGENFAKDSVGLSFGNCQFISWKKKKMQGDLACKLQGHPICKPNHPTGQGELTPSLPQLWMDGGWMGDEGGRFPVRLPTSLRPPCSSSTSSLFPCDLLNFKLQRGILWFEGRYIQFVQCFSSNPRNFRIGVNGFSNATTNSLQIFNCEDHVCSNA